jgi:Ni/Co efflux regulator RcnB
MKTTVSTLLALSVLAGIFFAAAPAAAFDSKTFWQQQDNNHGN